ncbi:MAG: ester cyclase [Candidatus Sericytochromatia bacterium]
MSEQNKALVRRVFESMSKGDLSMMDEVISPEYKNYNMPTPAPGAEGLKQLIGAFRSGFPDFKVDLEQVLADGDRVITQGVWTGTHQGEFMGIPATGKPISVGYIDIWRFVDGKAVENWVQMDMVGMMQQLGVAPPQA